MSTTWGRRGIDYEADRLAKEEHTQDDPARVKELKEWVKAVSGDKGEGETVNLFVPHDMKASNLYVNATIEAQQNGFSLEWKSDRMLERENLGISPDAGLYVTTPTMTQEAFIEYTGAMMKSHEIKSRLAAYGSF